MSFDWNKAADDAGTAKLDEGYYRVRVKKVIRAKKDGTELRTKDGASAMLLVIYEVVGGEGEASRSFVLSPSGVGWLAQSFKDWDEATTQEWSQRGVTPEDFEDEPRAGELLVGKSGWVRVEPRGKYLNVDHVKQDDVPADKLQASKPVLQGVGTGPAAGAVEEDDIPF